MARLEIDVMAKGISGLLSDIDKIKEATNSLKGIKLDISGSGGQTVAKTLQDAKIATEEARAEGVRLNNVLKEQRIEQGKVASTIASAASAYRKLSNELNANRNNAKNLAADMFRLEQAGQKNTTAYRNLEQQFKRVQTTTNTLDSALKKIDGSLGQHQRNVGEYGRAFAGAVPYIDQFTTAAGLVATAIFAIRESFQTNLKFDAIEYALEKVSGSSEEFRKNMDFLNNSADRLGLDLYTMAGAFKMWQGAVKYSNLTAEQSRQIFESVANAGAKMKLSTDEVRGTFLALSQMLSKGTVSMEELRRQLGDRLPGAFSLAAKAMGISEMELNKLVSTGQLASEEFLPKFANQLDISFGNDKTEKIDSMQASVARLGTEFDRLYRSENATKFFKTITDGITTTTSRLNNLVNSKGFEDFFLRVSSLATAPIESIIGTNAVGEVADNLNSVVEAQKNLNSLGVPWNTFIPDEFLYKYKYATEEVKENSKVILKNKEYWESSLKKLKSDLESLDVSEVGSDKWRSLNAQIKEAETNIKLYTSSNRTAVQQISKLAQALKDSANKASLSGLSGRAEELEKERQYYEQNIALAKGNHSAIETFTEHYRKRVADINAGWDAKELADGESFIQKRQKQFADLGKKNAEQIKNDAIAEVDTSFSFQRRLFESRAQTQIRALNEETKRNKEALDKKLQDEIKNGADIVETQNKYNAEKQKLQEDYYKKIEGLTEQQRGVDIITSFDGSGTSIGLAAINDQMDQLRIKLGEGQISANSFLEQMSDLSVQREQLGLLQSSIDGISGAFGNFFGDAIFDSENAIENLGKAFENLGKTVISELIKIGVKQALNLAIGKAGLAASTVASLAAAKTMAAAWSPVAASVSLASFGANGIPAAAAISSTFALTKALSLPGLKTGGYTGNVGINDIAGIVHGQEYVFDAASTKRIGVDNLKALQMGRVSPEAMQAYASVDRSIDVSSLLHGSGVSMSRSAPISMTPQRVDVVVHGEISGDVIKLVKDKADRDFNRFYGR